MKEPKSSTQALMQNYTRMKDALTKIAGLPDKNGKTHGASLCKHHQIRDCALEGLGMTLEEYEKIIQELDNPVDLPSDSERPCSITKEAWKEIS